LRHLNLPSAFVDMTSTTALFRAWKGRTAEEETQNLRRLQLLGVFFFSNCVAVCPNVDGHWPLLKRTLRSLLKLHMDHFYFEEWRHYYSSSCSGLCKNQSRFMQCDNMPLLLVLSLCALQCSGDGVEMISCQILSSSCAMTGGHCGVDKWP
jgi:hypothetical protein